MPHAPIPDKPEQLTRHEYWTAAGKGLALAALSTFVVCGALGLIWLALYISQ